MGVAMDESVSLVIPGRDTARTIGACLERVVPMMREGQLAEVVFVDDGSDDDTVRVVESFGVRCEHSSGRGPGAARNVGWRAATGTLVWFLDSDCVPHPDALMILLPHLEDPEVGAVGGSLGLGNPQSLLACLVHEEVMVRHQSMGSRVDFLAAANVVYRREILEQVGGFDERYLKAQDAELAFRVRAAGYTLAFDAASRVDHHYITRWVRYLRSQAQQGYWRVRLHLSHRGHAAGDSYSGLVDHVQPPLALLVMMSLPLLLPPSVRWIPPSLVLLLLITQIPMTWQLLRRTGRLRYICFAGLGFRRAFWRGIGMTLGVLGVLGGRLRR